MITNNETKKTVATVAKEVAHHETEIELVKKVIITNTKINKLK